MRPSPIPNSTKHTLLLSIIHGIGKQVKNQYWTFNFGPPFWHGVSLSQTRNVPGKFSSLRQPSSQFKRRLPASPMQRFPKILLCNPDILRHAKPMLI